MNYKIERENDKIFLYEDGKIVLIVEDVGQNDESIIASYITITNKFVLDPRIGYTNVLL